MGSIREHCHLTFKEPFFNQFDQKPLDYERIVMPFPISLTVGPYFALVMLAQRLEPVEATPEDQHFLMMASNIISWVWSMDPLPAATGVASLESLSGLTTRKCLIGYQK